MEGKTLALEPKSLKNHGKMMSNFESVSTCHFDMPLTLIWNKGKFLPERNDPKETPKRSHRTERRKSKIRKNTYNYVPGLQGL